MPWIPDKMRYDIPCPYCFCGNDGNIAKHTVMYDDQVCFRSERISKPEELDEILPAGYMDAEDVQARYQGADKEEILAKLQEWEFFSPRVSDKYAGFWSRFSQTTEVDYTDLFGLPAYQRPIIDPSNPEHQRYLQVQPDGTYFIKDSAHEGMAVQIQLKSGEHCYRRVCKYCHNPLPDDYGRNPTRFIPVIGITSAGKTVYLSQLLKNMVNYAAKVGLTAMVTTPAARSFIENNPIAAGVPLPAGTPAQELQQPLFYDIIYSDENNNKVTENIVLYDVAGEIFGPKFTGQPVFNAFAPFIMHADGFIILLDPMQFSCFSTVTADTTQRDPVTTVLNAIHTITSQRHVSPEEAGGQKNISGKCDKPIAMCISKIDKKAVQDVLNCPELLEDVMMVSDRGRPQRLFNASQYDSIADTLNTFISANESALSLALDNNYENYCYFGFTSLGCGVVEQGGQSIPVGPILTKRIEEPLLWLFHEFAFIGTNENVHYPNRELPPPCPECGCRLIYSLPEDSCKMVRKGLFKRAVPVSWECSHCGFQYE